MQTAVVIYAPYAVQTLAVPLMRQHAPDDFIRVPPHLTVMYPFVPVEQMAQAETRLRQIAAGFAPFDLTLSGYGQFPGVTYMQPTDPEPVRALSRAVFAAFPQHPPYGGQFGNEITPHLTVALWRDQPPVTLPAYTPVTFRVERLHFIYGMGSGAFPWLTYAVIPLGA